MHESDIVIWTRRIPPRVATVTENDDDADDADDDDKNGDDTRTRIHEKSRIERDRGIILRMSETKR